VEHVTGRVAVITGAASGIGFGIAEAMAAEGMRVMLADLDVARLARKEAQLRDAGCEVASHPVDVGDPDAVDALATAVLARFGAIHVVCNNAASSGVTTAGWELPFEDWEAVIRVNLLGVVNGIRTFVPLLLDAGEESHIVNVASLAAVTPVPELASYTASKHAVLGLTDALDAELRAIDASIGVTLVMPGLVRTRIGQGPTAPDPVGPLAPGQMDPREVGTHVVRAIRENRLHLFTHPELLEPVRARFARLTAG
jgi:NAD(P)-dependent dehydrogenase (short-subunit alcohol dehydrogenase family)